MMRIAVFGYAHPWGKKHKYGAERIIWYMIQELKWRGHECVVFSVEGCDIPGFEYIRMPKCWDNDHDIYFEALKKYEAEKNVKFQFVHSFQASGCIANELRVNWKYCLHPFFHYMQFPDNIISYSHKLNWTMGGHTTMIHYGLPEKDYSRWSKKAKTDYFCWIGRMDQGKAPDLAIDIAKRAGVKLILMGPAYHYPYFCESVFPHIDNENVIWIRGVDDEIKRKVFLNAKGFINPLWEKYSEMLGIVNIESIACGTPIVAVANNTNPYRSAINFYGDSKGEIIDHGKHGFIVSHDNYEPAQREMVIEQAADYIKRIDEIDRAECRKRYEEEFTAKKMVDRIEMYYRAVIGRVFVRNITDEIEKELNNGGK